MYRTYSVPTPLGHRDVCVRLSETGVDKCQPRPVQRPLERTPEARTSVLSSPGRSGLRRGPRPGETPDRTFRCSGTPNVSTRVPETVLAEIPGAGGPNPFYRGGGGG